MAAAIDTGRERARVNRSGMSEAAEPCEGCRDDSREVLVERTLAAWLRLLCSPCLQELVQLRPSRPDAGSALGRLTAAAAMELGRRILERDRV